MGNFSLGLSPAQGADDSLWALFLFHGDLCPAFIPEKNCRLNRRTQNGQVNEKTGRQGGAGGGADEKIGGCWVKFPICISTIYFLDISFKNPPLGLLIGNRALHVAGKGSIIPQLDSSCCSSYSLLILIAKQSFKCFVIFPDFPAWQTAFCPREIYIERTEM